MNPGLPTHKTGVLTTCPWHWWSYEHCWKCYLK